MAKRTSNSGGFGPARNLNHERLLCEAIREGLQVQLRYDDDMSARTYQPHAVFYSNSERTAVAVMGLQVRNPAEPSEADKPRRFDVASIRQIELTQVRFPREDFNRTSPIYKHGIICP